MTASTAFLIFFVVVIGILGLLIGSFLNVVAYRVPAGKSIVSPPSACPNCHSPIKWYDNVPVFSWLLLRGKCRNCAQPISPRYLVVELVTGLLFVAVAIWFAPRLADGLGGTAAAAIGELLLLVAFVFLAAIAVVLALIDIDTHKLPNSIVLPAYIVSALLAGVGGLLTGDFSGLLGALIGGAALFAFYFLLALIYPRGMGFGDVKLAGLLGIYLGFLGWGPLVVGAFAAFLLGGLFAVVLIIARRAGRGTGIPFGPWMLGGAWVGIFFGRDIAIGYLTLFGLA